ncbi:MAG TPA: alpha/beta hydrolase, partial [Abditibacteriaceae bacterium]|nr:alpha/beta hydrolase [Abditibacteriaceae bacterium]
MTLAESSIEHGYAPVNGVRLHYVECGNGPLVLLLHGFPDFWGGWRHQIKALSQAGFRVVAPDLRGYNLSDKPRGICNYSIDHLAGDVVALIHHLGEEKAMVAGHDWGGVIAWHLAMRQPKCLSKLIILNAPHPATFARELRTLRQMRKSSYALFFQLPRLPERSIRARDFALVKAVFRFDPTNRRAFSRRDIEQAVEALSQPRALTCALNYYRALRCRPRQIFQAKRIEAPTLLVWGEQDRYLGVQ